MDPSSPAGRSPCRGRRLPLRAAALVLLLVALPLTPATAVPDPRGSWTWPMQPQPQVVRSFEPPPDPYGPGHRGVDLAAVVGQRVLAVAPGRVSFAGQVAGRGVVVVDHGRLRSTYEPVLVDVRGGDRVGRGEVVGTVTLAGGHCLPVACLHLGARHGETYVDPLALLGSGEVRLLPLAGLPVGSRDTAVEPAAVPPLLRSWLVSPLPLWRPEPVWWPAPVSLPLPVPVPP